MVVVMVLSMITTAGSLTNRQMRIVFYQHSTSNQIQIYVLLYVVSESESPRGDEVLS